MELIAGETLGKWIQAARRQKGVEEKASAASEAGKVICPQCGSDMVLRKARQGKYAGKKFWGCSRFPKCKGLVPYEPEGGAK